MEWGGNRDPSCSADTELLTTRNPRRDYLTFVERKLLVRLFHSSVSSVYNIIFHFCVWLEVAVRVAASPGGGLYLNRGPRLPRTLAILSAYTNSQAVSGWKWP